MDCPACKGTGKVDMSELSVGQLIALHRERLGHSQEGLAALMDLRRHTIVAWELGRKEPTMQNCRDVAKALRINLSDLIPE